MASCGQTWCWEFCIWNSRKQEYLSWAGKTLKLFLITGITEGSRQNKVFAFLTFMSLRGCLRQPCSYTSPYLWPFGLGQSQLQTTQSFKSQHPEQTPRKGDWVKHRQSWKENGSRQGAEQTRMLRKCNQTVNLLVGSQSLFTKSREETQSLTQPFWFSGTWIWHSSLLFTSRYHNYLFSYK